MHGAEKEEGWKMYMYLKYDDIVQIHISFYFLLSGNDSDENMAIH